MKYIISINGIDNIGKTSLLKHLEERNRKVVSIEYDLKKYGFFSELTSRELYKWWFKDSSPEEFCDKLYFYIAKRNKAILENQKPIIFVDKGIFNFDARIIATLLKKNLSTDDALKLIKKYKQTHNVSDIENLKIYLFNKERYNHMVTKYQDEMYKEYQIYQMRILESQLEEKVYHFSYYVEDYYNIPKVYENFVNDMFKHFRNRVNKLATNRKIFLLGGMSESGKSYLGKYISEKYNIWNLKLKYFFEMICTKYNIDDPDIFYSNDCQITAILLADEINSFLEKHYYKKAISLESLHSTKLALSLKQLFGLQVKIINVDSTQEARLNRVSTEDEKNLLLKKDAQKKQHGLIGLSDIADFNIINNGSLVEFNKNIENIIANMSDDGSYWRVRKIENYKLPFEYKDQLKKFYYQLIKSQKSNIALFLISGSCGNEAVYPGWSDIDIILGVENKTKGLFETIKSLCKKSTIKIGVTIYSKSEISNCKVDGKTLCAFYLVTSFKNSPIIWQHDLRIPSITLDDINIYNNYGQFEETKHELQRALYSIKGFDIQKMVKLSTKFMKILLIREGIYTIKYPDVFEEFSKCFNVPFFDIERVIEQGQSLDEFYEYILYILDMF